MFKAIRKYSDEELVVAIGTEKDINPAIVFLYEQHAEAVGSFIISKGGTRQDGQDVFQEAVIAFINVVRAGKFRGEASVKTFLISISKNIWHNEIKRRQSSDNREKVFEYSRELIEADITQYIGDRERSLQFRDLFARLGENCKKILLLFYYENMPIKDMVSHLPYENEQVIRNKKYKCLQQLTGLVKQNALIRQKLK